MKTTELRKPSYSNSDIYEKSNIPKELPKGFDSESLLQPSKKIKKTSAQDQIKSEPKNSIKVPKDPIRRVNASDIRSGHDFVDKEQCHEKNEHMELEEEKPSNSTILSTTTNGFSW